MPKTTKTKTAAPAAKAATTKATAEKVAKPKKSAAKAAPKAKDFEALKKSSLPMNFVKSNEGCWDHDKWLGFLDYVKSKGYEISDKDTEDKVGLLLEEKKEQFFAN